MTQATGVPTGSPVILISIDTLRADRLPVYGYAGVETPAIDALRRDAILFESAWSQVPLTLPSHASLLSGVLPPRHGVRDNMGYLLDTAPLPWLPRLLKSAGYATGAAVSAFVLRRDTGFGDDFDFFDDDVEIEIGGELGSQQRPGPDTLAAAQGWLREVKDRPFFLFFHIYEPHDPYDPPEPWASRYASAYDGEVAYSDDIVGELLDELRRLGLYERSLIVLVSDHGEALMEHGEEKHGILLHREVMRVPLLIKLPGGEAAGTTNTTPTGLHDVAPTIGALLGLAEGGYTAGGGDTVNTLEGVNILEADPNRTVYSETYYPRLHFGWSELTSLTGPRFRLIQGPDPELYDLAVDPAESRNVLLENRREYGELKQELAGYDQAFRPPAGEDEETRARLEALGYLGSSVDIDVSGPLKDPKAGLAILEELKQALLMIPRGQAAEAADRLRGILEREPGMVDAWEHLGKALHVLGDLDESLAAYRKALELSGGAPHIALPTAALLLRTGRLDDARLHAEMALPAQPAAYDLLAQIALAQGDLTEARRQTDRSLETRGQRIEPLVTQAQLLLEEERPEAAVAATYDAEKAFGDRTRGWELLHGLWLTRGTALAQLGDADGAEAAFQREIELFPEELSPYTRLALLYAIVGRAPEAGESLQRMVEANPTPRAHAQAVKTLRALGDERLAEAALRQALDRWPDATVLRDLVKPSG